MTLRKSSSMTSLWESKSSTIRSLRFANQRQI
jgi:ABC-type cobalt transport system substrate-binding protein